MKGADQVYFNLDLLVCCFCLIVVVVVITVVVVVIIQSLVKIWSVITEICLLLLMLF